MKLLLLILMAFPFNQLTPKNGNPKLIKTTVLFFNSHKLYGMGIDKSLFWIEYKMHDTLIINDKSYNAFLDTKFRSLKDTVLYNGIDDLRYGVAFIREYSNKKKDTLYSSPWLRYFKIGNRDYVDTTLFFKNTFSKFLIYE